MKYLLIVLVVLIVSISIGLAISFLIRNKTKLKKKRYIVLFTSIISLFIVFVTSISYLSVYNKADKSVKEYLKDSENVSVRKISNGYFFDGKGSDEAIIFYPGAKVEYISYAPLMHKLADEGIDTFLIKMPFNMAVFGESRASKIIKKYNYKSYYMAGHSLGGVVASSYAKKNDLIKGVILLASYSTKNINDKKVLSIYGSKDGILDKKAYEKNKKNISKNLVEMIIDGANHSQFGNYGLQKHDNKSTISYDMQQNVSISYIKQFMIE